MASRGDKGREWVRCSMDEVDMVKEVDIGRGEWVCYIRSTEQTGSE
jgi:hypothetical protein